MIDLADLQWWQAFAAIVGALGLSPAPWILGLALGRIQFAKPAREDYEQRIEDLKTSHVAAIAALAAHHAEVVAGKDERAADLRASRDYYRDARNVERDRADKATDQLAEGLELMRLNAHLLESFDEATKGDPT